MKTFEKWLNKKGYQFTKEVIMDGAKVEYKTNKYVIQMYRHRRGGYITYYANDKTVEFYTVKEIQDLVERLEKFND